MPPFILNPFLATDRAPVYYTTPAEGPAVTLPATPPIASSERFSFGNTVRELLTRAAEEVAKAAGKVPAVQRVLDSGRQEVRQEARAGVVPVVVAGAAVVLVLVLLLVRR